MNYPNDNASLIARMYNGLDERKGWPIVIVKPIQPIIRAIPVGEIKPRPPKKPVPVTKRMLATMKAKLYKLFGL